VEVKHFLSSRLIRIIGIAVLSGSLVLATPSKLAPELSTEAAGSNVKVIIQFKQAPLASDLLSIGLLGGIVSSTLGAVNALIATLPKSGLQSLASNPNVLYVSSDRPLHKMVDYSTAAVNASAAWNSSLTGLGVTVAVIDSGIAQSADLDFLKVLPRVVYRRSFANSFALGDRYGHGTHVAGIIGANGAASSCSNCTRTLKGVAPNATLVDLQVLDATGSGTDSAVMQAIDQAITLKDILNIRVINLSLGRPVYESYKLDPLCQAVEAAWKAGLTVVVAAGNDGRDNTIGNDGYGTIGSPANDPYVITVGAMKAMGTYTRTDDLIASYSSKGPSGIDFVVKPDLVAPGNHVVSLESAGSTLANDPLTAVPLSYYEATTDSTISTHFMMLNGTSMATPVVSGAVADLLEGEPSLTPDQIKARLMKTAYKTFPASSTAVDDTTGQSFTSYYDIFTIGAGYLDIAAALSNHDPVKGNALSPTATYNATDGTVYLVFDPSSTWNQTTVPVSSSRAVASVWSVQNVWGPAVVNANKAVWGKGTVWSSSGVSGFDAIWSTCGVWGKETDEGSSTVSGTRAVWGKDSTTSDSDSVFTVSPR
jgi:serine protease AprX